MHHINQRSRTLGLNKAWQTVSFTFISFLYSFEVLACSAYLALQNNYICYEEFTNDLGKPYFNPKIWFPLRIRVRPQPSSNSKDPSPTFLIVIEDQILGPPISIVAQSTLPQPLTSKQRSEYLGWCTSPQELFIRTPDDTRVLYTLEGMELGRDSSPSGGREGDFFSRCVPHSTMALDLMRQTHGTDPLESLLDLLALVKTESPEPKLFKESEAKEPEIDNHQTSEELDLTDLSDLRKNSDDQEEENLFLTPSSDLDVFPDCHDDLPQTTDISSPLLHSPIQLYSPAIIRSSPSTDDSSPSFTFDSASQESNQIVQQCLIDSSPNLPTETSRDLDPGTISGSDTTPSKKIKRDHTLENTETKRSKIPPRSEIKNQPVDGEESTPT